MIPSSIEDILAENLLVVMASRTLVVIRPFLIGTVKYEFLVFRFQKLVLCSPYR